MALRLRSTSGCHSHRHSFGQTNLLLRNIKSGMLQNSNPSIQFVLSGKSDGFDLQEAFGLHREERRFLTCKRHLACTGENEGLRTSFATLRWKAFPAQVRQCKQAALFRTAPELPSYLRVDIEHLFPDSADEVGKASTMIW
ncbi:hypothetical protein CCR75_003210 [Bremia lactucae]|uniref:Uncharacterized protein n=1 Tax=Bremia lactucae TaxID=4779 RepID=A0A976NZH3_BRELC|nr:hypothetical protein CCR75_003210 [Bremia lactucae]